MALKRKDLTLSMSIKNNLKTKGTRVYIYITCFVDILLLTAFIFSFIYYANDNQSKNYESNVKNIADITNSNAQIVEVALNSVTAEVERAYNYCEGKSLSEIMEYLEVSSTEEDEYQLLEIDLNNSSDVAYAYKGYSTIRENGVYQTVGYKRTVALSVSINDYIPKSSDNSIIDGSIVLTQLFTNSINGNRCFGICCGIKVKDETIDKQYFIIKLKKESYLMDYVESKSQYGSLEVAICYSDGNYLAKGQSFRGDNFFDYIGRYNGQLTLDEKLVLQHDFVENKTGMQNYLNYANKECIFSYVICGENMQWMIITLVPTSEFVSGKLISLFPLLIITFLLILLIFNMVMLIMIVYKLQLSVEREQTANSSKTSFLSRMSHEIRTPLNAIIGYNSIAVTAFSSSKTESERIASIMKVSDCLYKSELASKQLLFVINDVLDMSAIESGRINIAKEKFDFKGLITTLTMVFYSQAKAKKINFEVFFETVTEEWLIGDQMRVNQILTNLLSNSLKFTPVGGVITLRISQLENKGDKICIRFEVSDTGIGMSQDFLNRIWLPFEQADSSISRRFGGSGLGLSITKSLTDIMDGSINVSSALGSGSTFTVDIPFEIIKDPIKKTSKVYDFSRINALVVDDDPDTCEYITALFQRCGARCASVFTGKDAIVAMKASIDNNDKFSVCLVDWHMPEMDGIETIKRIKEIAQDDLLMVVITAYDFAEVSEKISKMNIRFLAKPLFQSSLFDLLANMSGSEKDYYIRKNITMDLKGMRILLAEDNEMNKEIAMTIMQSEGIIVDCANNGEEVIDMFLESEVGTYNAILMDVHMPKIDGLQATTKIRQSSHPEAKIIPIIAMTADAFAENIAETKAAGMNDHISKPIDVATLFETLKKYVKR